MPSDTKFLNARARPTVVATSDLLVHATNVTGLGARHVVESLLLALARDDQLNGATVFLPDDAIALDDLLLHAGATVMRRRRLLPHSVSRMLECLLPQRAYTRHAAALVLGDVPLRGVRNQVVLVHQPHLLSPAVSGFASAGFKYDVMRSVFRRNLGDAAAIIVQSDAMRDQLARSYPDVSGRIAVIPQPAPHWFTSPEQRRPRNESGRLKLLYPAAGYPHKNHKLLALMNGHRTGAPDVEIVITLAGDRSRDHDTYGAWVVNVGRLDWPQLVTTYAEVDALFFPSLLESYGLPLVEGMMAGLPIVCADLPYAHWLCGAQAIYFDPRNAASAWAAISELKRRVESGWSPDWGSALAKLPRDWDEVARSFLAVVHALDKPTA